MVIEVVIKNYLDKTLSVPVYVEKPSNPPRRYVLFERTGGGKREFLSKPTFAFQSYAESMYEAAKLNEELKEKIEELILLDEFSKVSLNSDYNFTDTTTKQYRYQAVFDIVHF